MKQYGSTAEHFAKIGLEEPQALGQQPVRAVPGRVQPRRHPGLENDLRPTDQAAVLADLRRFGCGDPGERGVRRQRTGLADRAIEIVGQSMTTDFENSFDGTCKALIGHHMNVAAAQQVYEQSGLGPDDFQVIELHDCFSANELLLYEALGLCGEGEAAKSIDNGDTTYGGRWVVNPSGGLISKGHPLGATGLAQCAELTWQLQRYRRQTPGGQRHRSASAQHRPRRRRRGDRLPARPALTRKQPTTSTSTTQGENDHGTHRSHQASCRPARKRSGPSSRTCPTGTSGSPFTRSG